MCPSQKAATRTAWVRSFRIILNGIEHFLSFGLILVLPIGIYQDNPDSTNVAISGHIGTGQYASVIRDCNGPVYGVGSTFNNYAVKSHLAVPPGRNSALVIGFAYGKWRSENYRPAIHDYNQYNGNQYASLPGRPIEFSYVNPSISIETVPVGMGFGYTTGDRPSSLSEDQAHYANDVSFHVRFGNPKKFYLSASRNENTPLVSGGGYFDAGFGLANAKNVNLYFGFCGGLYDSPGILFQTRFPLSKHVFFDGAFRYGSVAGVSETGFSAGLRAGF